MVASVTQPGLLTAGKAPLSCSQTDSAEDGCERTSTPTPQHAWVMADIMP